MKMYFEVDLGDLEKELLQGIQSRFKSSFDTAAQMADSDAKETAAGKLKGGLAKWNEGYSFHKVSDTTYVLGISGELADMMEDGIDVGQISKMIMNGNRAKHNASEHKDYVDVPINLDHMAVSFHKDADSMMASFKRKEVTLSDFKRGGVKKENRFVARLQNSVIASKEKMGGDTSFLTIRRVTSSSVWPKQKFPGAKAFEEAARKFADNFTRLLESSL